MATGKVEGSDMLTSSSRLFFIATLVFHGHTFRLYHQGKKPSPANNANVEMTAQQQTPMVAQQQAPGPAAYPAYTEYPSQTQPQQQPYQGQPPQQQPYQGQPLQQQQQRPDRANRRDRVGRRGEEAEDLGQREEHGSGRLLE